MRRTREDMIQCIDTVIDSRGGEWVSAKEDYQNENSLIVTRCFVGHVWPARAQNLLYHHSWCPFCTCDMVGEQVTRFFFEGMFRERFAKIRPDWLINPDTGCRLELDGLAERRPLAFEYGRYYHQTDERKKLDALKLASAKARGITIVVVSDQVPFAKLQDHIVEACRAAGVEMPASIPQLDYRTFPIQSNKQRLAEETKMLAAARGLEIKSPYLRSDDRQEMVCRKNHTVWLCREELMRGRGCASCAWQGMRTPWSDILSIIQSKGGSCDPSEEAKYFNSNSKIDVTCAAAHTFPTTPGSLKEDHWCRKCANIAKSKNAPNKLKLDRVKAFAAERKVIVKSEDYKNNTTLLDLFCTVHQHQFPMSFASFKRSPYCCPKGRHAHRTTKRLTLSDVQASCEAVGLECVSTAYPGSVKHTDV